MNPRDLVSLFVLLLVGPLVKPVLAQAPNRFVQYRDPQGRFQFQYPRDWSVQAVPDGLRLRPAWAGVSADLILKPGTASAQRLLEAVQGLIRGQSPDYREIGRSACSVGGIPGQVVQYTVINPQGARRLIQIVAFVNDGLGYVLLVEADENELAAARAAWDAILRSFQVAGGVGGSAGDGVGEAQPQPGAAARWAVRDLPGQTGVQVTEQREGGAVGELRVLKPGSRRASSLLKTTLAGLPVQDLKVIKAGHTQGDRFACCTYQGVRQGAAVKGELAVSVGERDASVEHIWAPAGTFDARRAEVRSILNDLTQTDRATGGGGGAAADAERVQLTKTANRDGTAWISVPAGWQVSEGQGMLRARGPQGTIMVGIWCLFFTPAAAQQMAAMGGPVGEMAVADCPPLDQAIGVVLPQVGRMGGMAISNLEVLRTEPAPGAPGWACVQVRYISESPGGPAQQMEALAFVSAAPTDANGWVGSLNLLTAPREVFAQNLPLLWRIYQSYGISQALIASRMAQVLKDQRAITGIIQEVTAHKAEVQYKETDKWDRYIRGVSRTRDLDTGETRDLAGWEDLHRWAEDNPNLNLDRLRMEP